VYSRDPVSGMFRIARRIGGYELQRGATFKHRGAPVFGPRPSRPRPPRMRSPRPATTSLPPTRAAAFIAVLHDVALAEILAATARASCPVVTPRDPRGGYPRGPCGRQSHCGG
jgi:hypothetical protein